MFSFLNGYKTKIAGVGGIITSVGVLIVTLTTSPVEMSRVIEGVIGLLSALAVLGLGGKMQKMIDAVKSTEVKDDPTTSKDNPVV